MQTHTHISWFMNEWNLTWFSKFVQNIGQQWIYCGCITIPLKRRNNSDSSKLEDAIEHTAKEGKIKEANFWEENIWEIFALLNFAQKIMQHGVMINLQKWWMADACQLIVFIAKK